MNNLLKILKDNKWTKKDSIKLSIYATELVIDNFLKKYPHDNRPQEAVEAAKKILESNTKENQDAGLMALENIKQCIVDIEKSKKYKGLINAYSAEDIAYAAKRTILSAISDSKTSYPYAYFAVLNAASSLGWSEKKMVWLGFWVCSFEKFDKKREDELINICKEFAIEILKDK